MRALLLALALSCLAPFAWAAAREDAIGVTFPDAVGGLKFEERETFPQKALGSAITYSGPGRLLASVYVYNGGLTSIPEGTGSDIVEKHFAQVLGEAKQMESTGRARRVTMPATPAQITRSAGCGPQFIWKAFEMDLDGELIASYTYMTVLKNNFVKLRISHPKSNAEGRQGTERFVAGLSKVLGHC